MESRRNISTHSPPKTINLPLPPQGRRDIASISPSTYGRFSACEYSWALRVLWGYSPISDDSRVAIGDLFHVVASRVTALPPEQRTLTEARYIVQQETSSTDTGAGDAGTGWDEMEFVLRVWELVENWFRIENVEELHVLGSESWIEAIAGDFSIRGVADRIDHCGNGSLSVTDYKTGHPPIGREATSRRMGVQMYALALTLMGHTVEEGRLMYLGVGEVDTIEWGLSVRDLTMSNVSVSIGKMRKAALSGAVTASPGKHCLGCQLVPVCPTQGNTAPTEAELFVSVERAEGCPPTQEAQETREGQEAGAVGVAVESSRMTNYGRFERFPLPAELKI